MSLLNERNAVGEISAFQRKSPRTAKINIHRALKSTPFPKHKIITILGLPVLFNVLTFFIENKIIYFWQKILELFIRFTEMPATLSVDNNLGKSFLGTIIPYIDIPIYHPSNTQWLIGASFFLIIIVLSYILPEKAAPLRYAFRLIAFIQGTALLYFTFWPADFPHSVKEYTLGYLKLGFELIFFVPWLYALTYYIFGFKLYYDIALTLITILFLSIAIPMQCFAHTLILYEGSLLWLPLLYFLFGLLLVIMAIISLFSWAMTWQQS